MELKDRLRDLRIDKGLSQAELAKDLGISPGAIGMYESGKRLPKEEIREAIADYFNVDIGYLMGYEHASTYLLNPEAMKILIELEKRPELKVLLDVGRKLAKDDIEAIVKLLDK